MISDRPINAKRQTLEPPEVRYDSASDDNEDDRLHVLRYSLRREDEVIEQVSKHQNRKVKSGKLSEKTSINSQGVKDGEFTHVMMDVCYTAHDQEWDCHLVQSET